MRVLELRTVKDCVDADLVRELVLDRPIDRHFVEGLKELGTLEYYRDFPRPLFRLYLAGLCQMQGVEGASTCRAMALRSAPPSVWDSLVTKLEKGA